MLLGKLPCAQSGKAYVTQYEHRGGALVASWYRYRLAGVGVRLRYAHRNACAYQQSDKPARLAHEYTPARWEARSFDPREPHPGLAKAALPGSSF
jgi:hypothetical protein